MANGHIDFTPEMAPLAKGLLPLTVLETGRALYGGAVRVEISGEDIEEGKAYQLVVTDEPMRRCIELVKSPNQDA